MDEFCPQHIQLTNDMTEIKVSLRNIEKEITQGVTFKTAMVAATIGIVVTIMVQIAVFGYLYGGLTRQVLVNTERLTVIEKYLVGK